MRNLLLILLVVVAIGCDDMQKPVMNVITEPAATEEPATPVETQYPTITYENALALAPGVYRFRPNGFSQIEDFSGEGILEKLYWGSVGLWGELLKGSPADAPKILVAIDLNPQPYTNMADGTPAIESEVSDGVVIVDELLVEIIEAQRESTEQGGERGNKYEYRYVSYEGKVLENLTNPDRAFEYE